ncbi:BRO1 [Candida pseudojiufengensis]|uniref:BRO1 n=1 Tax=Candida pseudojiufengensis TaxID=497109 RepID=UPI0022259B35|nr:BRO1 [Candida pseudojiufengensis]KAI5959096.1 BRO1 [Candida pseudojiufengensis]
MKTHLITVPRKKTEQINWIKPINNYLLSIYGNTSSYQNDLSSFDKLREDIRGVNADNTGLKLYFKYYSQLEILDMKIQFSSLNKSKKIEFIWHDAFQNDIIHSQNSLAFEKANILFNIASLLTKFANNKYIESQGNNDKSSIVESIKMLKQAAGIYEFINENFLHAPSDDLSQSTIKFLNNLSLAQCQEIFTINTINNDLNQSKNSLISKLCKSTSILYEECYQMISNDEKEDYKIIDDFEKDEFLDKPEDEEENEEENSKFVTAQIDQSWISIIYFKFQFYKSLSFYFNALQLEANRKYGESIGFLNESKNIIDNINPSIMRSISKNSGTVYEILDNFKYQKDVVDIKINDLTKDNDLIYHDLVLKNANLNQLSPMQVAKIIPLNEMETFKQINEQGYSNFLNNVIPINIHELSSFYSEEKSQLLRNEIDYFEVSNEEIKSLMDSLNLPQAFDQIKQSLKQDNDDIPFEVVNKVSEISQKSEEIKNLESSNYNLKQQIRDQISKNPQLGNMNKVLYDATKSDEKLSQLIDKSFYNILIKGPQSVEVSNLFKSNNVIDNTFQELSLLDKDDSQEKQIKIIENFLKDLNTINLNKHQIIDNLKTKIHSDDISDVLIINSRQKSNNEIKTIIFPQELKKFQPFINKLDSLINRSKIIIKDLQEQWEILLQNPEIKNLQKSTTYKKQKIHENTSKINKFFENWKKYYMGLIKGNQFYKNLLSHIKDQLNNQNFGNQYHQPIPPQKIPPQQQSPLPYQRPPMPPQKQSMTSENSYNWSQTSINNGAGNNSPGLIYDQPSTYDPNMYDFFSKKANK